MRKPKGYKFLSQYWLEHYCRDGRCDLCGNQGRFKGLSRISHYCICPNGQVMRAALELKENGICPKRKGVKCETPISCKNECKWNNDPIHPNREL